MVIERASLDMSEVPEAGLPELATIDVLGVGCGVGTGGDHFPEKAHVVGAVRFRGCPVLVIVAMSGGVVPSGNGGILRPGVTVGGIVEEGREGLPLGTAEIALPGRTPCTSVTVVVVIDSMVTVLGVLQAIVLLASARRKRKQ